MHRREFLAGAAGVGVVSVAGCGGETWEGVAVRITDAAAHPSKHGWLFDATVEIDFNFAREDDSGIRDLVVEVYDEDGNVAATDEIGDVLWKDVPEEERYEEDGYDHATVEREVSVQVFHAFPLSARPRYEERAEENDGKYGVRYVGDDLNGYEVVDEYEPVSVDEEWPQSSDGDED